MVKVGDHITLDFLGVKKEYSAKFYEDVIYKIAKAAKVGSKMVEMGDLIADPCEVSLSRREDYDFVAPKTKADDLLSSNNGASAVTARGHQFPLAFLAIVSGLDKHDIDSDTPLPYVHVDIAGSGIDGGDWQHGKPSAAPVSTLIKTFIG